MLLPGSQSPFLSRAVCSHYCSNHRGATNQSIIPPLAPFFFGTIFFSFFYLYTYSLFFSTPVITTVFLCLFWILLFTSSRYHQMLLCLVFWSPPPSSPLLPSFPIFCPLYFWVYFCAYDFCARTTSNMITVRAQIKLISQTMLHN